MILSIYWTYVKAVATITNKESGMGKTSRMSFTILNCKGGNNDEHT